MRTRKHKHVRTRTLAQARTNAVHTRRRGNAARGWARQGRAGQLRGARLVHSAFCFVCGCFLRASRPRLPGVLVLVGYRLTGGAPSGALVAAVYLGTYQDCEVLAFVPYLAAGQYTLKVSEGLVRHARSLTCRLHWHACALPARTRARTREGACARHVANTAADVLRWTASTRSKRAQALIKVRMGPSRQARAAVGSREYL